MRRAERARPRAGRRTGRGCLVLVLVVAAVAITAWLARAPILTVAGSLVIEETPLAAADFVVVLGDNSVLRAARAAEIVRQRLAPKVVLFRPVHDPERAVLERLGISTPASHEVATLVLVQLGVPTEAIVALPSVATGTNPAIRDIASYAAHVGARNVAVVTYRSHTRRTGWLLRRALGPGARVMVTAATDDPFRADDWWRRRETARELVTETLRWGNSLVLGDAWPERWSRRAPRAAPGRARRVDQQRATRNRRRNGNRVAPSARGG